MMFFVLFLVYLRENTRTVTILYKMFQKYAGKNSKLNGQK